MGADGDPVAERRPGPAFQQAIDAGVDYIASSGEARSLYEEQAQAAADAGIKILSCFDTEPPGGEETNIYTQCGDTTFVEKTGPLMADWAIVDSGGTANVLIVSIPDFAVLKAETDAYIAELEKNCADCEYTELNITIPQLVGGEVPAAVASQLQSNPDIDYAFFSFGSLPSGVTSALDSAGLLDQVTVYGQDFSAFGLEEIVAGTMGAWSADPKAYAGWLMVDAAARLELGMELEEERVLPRCPPTWWRTATAQEILDCCKGDWYPPTMEEDFKALWGVSLKPGPVRRAVTPLALPGRCSHRPGSAVPWSQPKGEDDASGGQLPAHYRRSPIRRRRLRCDARRGHRRSRLAIPGTRHAAGGAGSAATGGVGGGWDAILLHDIPGLTLDVGPKGSSTSRPPRSAATCCARWTGGRHHRYRSLARRVARLGRLGAGVGGRFRYVPGRLRGEDVPASGYRMGRYRLL